MPQLIECTCGSKLRPTPQVDARGIFLCYSCLACEADKFSRYRSEVLSDPNYWHDEPIEE